MPVFSDPESRSDAHRSLVSYDLESGRVESVAASSFADGETARRPSQPPLLPWDADRQQFLELPSAAGPEGVDEDSVAGACTPPGPNLFTHSFPWTTTYKILTRFNVGGIDFFYVCSAASASSFHLMTAGHCLFNHDPNDDGNTADADWADEVWVWAAQTDLVNPFLGAPNDEDRPYSFAKAVFLRSYTGWTDFGDFNHDMGFITLDRRTGNYTGWMGREAGVQAGSLNFNGYPAETPFVPAGESRQYPGFDPNNVDFYTTFRINLCAFIYGGHSGGPDWRFDGADRFIQGVNSTSDRMGDAEATRLTIGKFNDLNNVIAEDEAVRPPVPRPDLAENFFTTTDDLKDLLTHTVTQGDPFTMEYTVLNAGFASSGTITVDFYLSTNNIISSFDTLVGTRTLPSLAAFTFTNPTVTLNANVAPGTYFAGWIMRSAVPEYGGDLICTNDPCTNVGIIADETLTVTAPTCTVDVWEPDDVAAQANTIFSGQPQTHSICPVADDDWTTFFLPASPGGWEVTLETTGPAASDTRMWLYDGGLGLVEFDDDDGAGFFSLIDRGCATDPLPGGTYFVEVDEFGDDDEIESYTLSFDATPCQASCVPDFPLFCSLSTDAWANDNPGSTDNVDSYSCNGFNYSGPEYTYIFQPGSDTEVTVQLTGLSADLDLLVLQDGGAGCDPGTCIASSTAGGASNEILSFSAVGGTTYYIVVDGFAGATSSYSIALICGDLLFHDGFESGDTSAWSQ